MPQRAPTRWSRACACSPPAPSPAVLYSLCYASPLLAIEPLPDLHLVTPLGHATFWPFFFAFFFFFRFESRSFPLLRSAASISLSSAAMLAAISA